MAFNVKIVVVLMHAYLTLFCRSTPTTLTAPADGKLVNIDCDMDIIIISTATFGENCGASTNNELVNLQIACNGLNLCEYTIDLAVIGDPAYRCEKEYVYDYTCLSTNDSYAYIGCYADTSTRALPYGPGGVSGYDPDSCSIACDDYRYFGVQAGGQCFCGSDWQMATQYGISTNCNSNQLGGAWANDIFLHYDIPPTELQSDFCSGCADGINDDGIDCYNLVDQSIYACRGTFSDGVANGASICASGYEVCPSMARVAELGLTASICGSIAYNDEFYASLQGGNGNGQCTDSGGDDFWGCARDTMDNIHILTAADGGVHASGCSPDVMVAYYNTNNIPPGWSSTNRSNELETASCLNEDNGGVLCCNTAIIEPTRPYTHLGCYADSSDRALPHGDPAEYGYDAASCSILCYDYRYFAVQNGGQCFCGNDWKDATRYGESTGCADLKGGAWANDIFVHDGFPTSEPTSAPTPSPTSVWIRDESSVGFVYGMTWLLALFNTICCMFFYGIWISVIGFFLRQWIGIDTKGRVIETYTTRTKRKHGGYNTHYHVRFEFGANGKNGRYHTCQDEVSVSQSRYSQCGIGKQIDIRYVRLCNKVMFPNIPSETTACDYCFGTFCTVIGTAIFGSFIVGFNVICFSWGLVFNLALWFNTAILYTIYKCCCKRR